MLRWSFRGTWNSEYTCWIYNFGRKNIFQHSSRLLPVFVPVRRVHSLVFAPLRGESGVQADKRLTCLIDTASKQFIISSCTRKEMDPPLCTALYAPDRWKPSKIQWTESTPCTKSRWAISCITYNRLLWTLSESVPKLKFPNYLAPTHT